jgi:hypothetical protein
LKASVAIAGFKAWLISQGIEQTREESLAYGRKLNLLATLHIQGGKASKTLLLRRHRNLNATALGLLLEALQSDGHIIEGTETTKGGRQRTVFELAG